MSWESGVVNSVLIRYHLPVTPSRLHDLAERLTSLFRASFRQGASAHDLKLVQLEALVYLASANRYSDTAAALTEYLGITKGTVSQTIKALERRGLVAKVTDERDARVQHCLLTDEGLSIVKRTHPAGLFANLGDTELHGEALESLLRVLQTANQHRSFGVCHSCRHFGPRSRGGRCGLTAELLSVKDSRRICREHEHG